jgi:hypothetical protein
MIHILQLLCPRRHCFMAVAYDDATTNSVRARLELSRGLTAIGAVRVCALCRATRFHLEDGVTRFRTLAEAEPHLMACQADQVGTRRRLLRERN